MDEAWKSLDSELGDLSEGEREHFAAMYTPALLEAKLRRMCDEYKA
jgi:hypothetical protein